MPIFRTCINRKQRRGCWLAFVCFNLYSTGSVAWYSETDWFCRISIKERAQLLSYYHLQTSSHLRGCRLQHCKPCELKQSQNNRCQQSATGASRSASTIGMLFSQVIVITMSLGKVFHCIPMRFSIIWVLE